MQIPQIPDLHDEAVAKAHENHVRVIRELAEQTRTVELAGIERARETDG
jgi:hypothetical protein